MVPYEAFKLHVRKLHRRRKNAGSIGVVKSRGLNSQ